MIKIDLSDLNSRLGNIEALLLELKGLGLIAETGNGNKWLNLDEIREYLPQKPSKATLYAKLGKNEILAHKRGKKWFFLKDEIDTYLKQGRKRIVSEIEADADQFLSNQKKGSQNGK
jgi:hypothetical protein